MALRSVVSGVLSNKLNKLVLNVNSSPLYIKCRTISTTACQRSLKEFFDDEKNWGATDVKSGRSWQKEELRLKSNTDLHKLWYILLKERNMLLTMEQECKDNVRLFPSPERLDKVADSMEALEEVVRERNKAYHMLETGETGERPTEMKTSSLGINYRYKQCEHLIPKEMNGKWLEHHKDRSHTKDVQSFLLKYREKLSREKVKAKTRNFNHVIGLMKRFPNLDMEAVKEQYPDVDIEKAKASAKYRRPIESW